jgi:hypothetical protein
MNRLNERAYIPIPADEYVDSLAKQQDEIRAIVEDYKLRQRRRILFRQIVHTAGWAVIFAAGMVWILRFMGLL